MRLLPVQLSVLSGHAQIHAECFILATAVTPESGCSSCGEPEVRCDARHFYFLLVPQRERAALKKKKGKSQNQDVKDK